ncbi:neuraminidase-like domain-containing protein, partial [Microcoleus sp. F6_B3]
MSDLNTIKNDEILKPFFDRYPDFELQNFDFFNTEAVEALNWEELDKDTICDRLKACQRLLRLGLDPSDAKKLLDFHEEAVQDEGEEGEMLLLASPEESQKLDSALAIASTPEAEFIQTSKLDPEKARETHRNATQTTAGEMLLLANVMQFASPRVGGMLADNAAQMRSDFQALPSYQKLFGSLDYLQCDPCQSIFSPAAYFVDLMRLVDKYITQPNNISGGKKLSDRRPDLENIPLTCDNTNDTISYVQIVNEVLEAALRKEQEDIWQKLATKEPDITAVQNQSLLNPPFNIYLQQIRDYLGYLKTDLVTVYKTFSKNSQESEIAWVREVIGISPEEYNFIVNTAWHIDQWYAKTKNLVAYWPLDEGSRNTVKDVVGNKSGTFIPHIVYETSHTLWSAVETQKSVYPEWIKIQDFPKYDSRYVVQLNKNYIEINDDSQGLKCPTCTIEAWFKCSSNQQETVILCDYSTTYMSSFVNFKFWSYRIFLTPDGKLNFSFSNSNFQSLKSYEVVEAKTEQFVSDGKWHYIVVIRNHSERKVRIYLDGKQIKQADTSYSKEEIHRSNSRLWLGASPLQNENHYFFPGQLAEIRIWNTALSPEEIKTRIEEAKTVIEQEKIKQEQYLSKKLDLAIADLQLLRSVGTNLTTKEGIQQIAKIKQFQKKYKLPLDVLCSFWHDIPTEKFDEKGEPPLFDRVFNNPLILNGKDKYNPNDENKSVWKIDEPENQSSSFGRSRLLAGLQISDNDLTNIAKTIWEDKTEIELDVANLSRLFRVSKILKLLGLKIEEYQLLLQFLGESIQVLEEIKIDKLVAITELSEWLKLSGFSVYELDYIIKGNIYSAVEVFVEETKMSDIITSLWQKVERPDQEKRNNFNNEQRQEQDRELNEQIAIHFGMAPGLFSVLAQLGAQTVKEQDYIQLLLSKVETQGSNWQKIVECLKFISRMRLLVSKLALTETELKSISHRPQSYNIHSLTELTVKDIQNLYHWKNQWLRVFNVSEGDIVKYFAEPSVEKLAKLTGWQQKQINRVIELLQDTNLYKSVEGLLKLKQCFDLCTTIGCNIDFLCDMCDKLKDISAADKWSTYQNIASTVVNMVKAKYDDKTWTSVSIKLDGKLNEQKRDLLTNLAFDKWSELKNLRQLSEHLMLDVEMTSCACNSRIQLAILSVQTYLQRCRMGLETGVTQINIPAVWWEWIMNYRIWEANRKVFLYPENYIEPSLRKNASPIFKELQDELLQSEITAETVEAAYRNYFDKFAELAKLQIVDGCRYSVKTPKRDRPVDTLFIVAKTITQPHTFYYRRCENPEVEKPFWGYWEKIDLQINSDYLAPVYVFNRLFVFWVETKEIQKSQDKPPTTKATIKYSFLNASQKWISPQTLIADVEISNILPVALDKEIQNSWQQVYPIVAPAKDSQSDAELIISWGGLSAILASGFNEKAMNFMKKCNAATKIASDLLPDSLSPDSLLKYNTCLTLSDNRNRLVATTVVNLVVFAGGNIGGSHSNKVDIFEYKDGQLTKQETSLTLSEGRDNLAAATVGNLVVFAGGNIGGSRSNKVDIFAYKDGQLTKQETSLTLSGGRDNLAAATVGNLVVFAGGYTGESHSNKLDIFEYKDGQLTKQETSLTLSEGRDN